MLKGQKKCCSIDNPGYEPEVVAVHPGGSTVAVGGSVRPVPQLPCPGMSRRFGGDTYCVRAGLPGRLALGLSPVVATGRCRGTTCPG